MTDNLEIREFAIREVDTDSREVIGVAVPWDTPTNVGGYVETIARGAVQDSDDAMLFWRHEEPIGRVLSSEDSEEGWIIHARISETPRGNEAYTLLRDEVITKFSIGFQPVEHAEDDDGNVTRTKIRVREVSLVPMPAYEGASVQEVRKNQTQVPLEDNMAEDAVKVADLVEVRETVENLERKISTFQAVEPETAPDTRSAGEVLKAIAKGDEETIRAYTGGTTADSVVQNGWVGDLTRIIDEAAPLRSLFATGTLPSEGNFIEYAQLKSNTMVVAEQDDEGDDLTFGKVQLETKTAPVKTYGGYTQLSRQEIERSSVNILDASLRAQAIATGKAMNTAVRGAFVTQHAAQITATNTVEIPDTSVDYADWLAAAVDAAEKFEALGLSMDALVVNSDAFKSLLQLTGSDGRPVFLVSGAGTNNVGTLDVRGLQGDLANIPVVLASGLTDEIAFVNRNALRLYASPVVRLQDENVINLSKDFSVYNYAAIANEIPSAIVPVVEA